VHFVIVGAGSSAGRFITILLNKKHQVSVYKHKPQLELPNGCEFIESLTNLSGIDGAIISSPTATHLEYANIFVIQRIPLLIEKPLSDSMKGVNALIADAKKNNVPVMMGLNLRFLPINQKIKQYIEEGKLGNILHADLYVGQYLPTWRPWLDYRHNYSSSYKQGGGVSLDLIHEIDLALHFFPKIRLKKVVATKLSDLEIDTEDFVRFATLKKPYVQVTLDYLHHSKTRQYKIVGSKGSINCDIINQRFEFRDSEGNEEIINSKKAFDVKATFAAEIESFLNLIKGKIKADYKPRTLAIDALEVALTGRKHVQR
jgi:predicted dehydrogenase